MRNNFLDSDCFDHASTLRGLHDWGDMALSPQQKRVWKRLINGKDCAISTLYRCAQSPYAADDEPRLQHQFVGMLIYRINRKLEGSGYRVRCGDRRYSYRLSEVN
jgi:hypothetical protein